MIRNITVLIITFFLARKYVLASRAGDARRNRYAVLYLLWFVISQSFIAFDWVMSLEYPWVSTLFGGYFFIEAFYAGIALSGLTVFFSGKKEPDQFHGVLPDNATLMFGFSLVWEGLFYAQFLVIWYGNIPEEAAFILKRISTPGAKFFAYLILAAQFFIPFITLLSRRVKSKPGVVGFLSLVILGGIFIERCWFLYPVVSLNPVVRDVEFFVMLLLAVYYIFIDPRAPENE